MTTSNSINPIHLVPKLPLELFKLVMTYLSRRKHDLFRCMLVSSYFNSITAPILYRSFNIAGLAPTDYIKANQADICKTSKKSLKQIDEPVSLSSSRLSRGRAHNLTLVQEVELEYHRTRCCPWTKPTWLTDWNIPILRIIMDPRLDNFNPHGWDGTHVILKNAGFCTRCCLRN